jgi:uncharacterized protein (TIGR03437 family)
MIMPRTWILFVSLASIAAAAPQIPIRFEPARGGGFVVRTPAGPHYLTPSAALRLSPNLEMRLPGHRRADPRTANLLPGLTNDLRGDTPQWRTGISQYGGIRYRRVYPGIDLVYHASQSSIEFDFELSPGASPDSISLEFHGARGLEISAMGDLIVHTPDRDFSFHAPRILQAGHPVAGGYCLLNATRAGFRVGAYDRKQPLIIDPVLGYSAGFGTQDSIQGIAVDPAGNVYIAGTTLSEIPLLNPIDPKPDTGNCSPESGRTYSPCETVFVAKFDPTGAKLLYSTYLGDIRDFGAGIAVDHDGNAYVAGTARAAGLLTPRDGQAWVRKLNAAGSAVLYQQTIAGDTAANAIAVDSQGNAYLAGASLALDFPAVNALQSLPPFQSLLGSNDGGTTWRALANLHALTVSSLAIDPARAATLYAATSSGLFKSIDAGAGWTRILPDAKIAAQVVVDPASAVYALYTDSAGASQIAKSADGGTTWKTLTAAVPLRNSMFPHSFSVLALDPQNPSVLWLADFPQIGPSIDRSTDGGASWTDMHDFPAFFIGDSLGGNPSEILVDPKNSSRVYACCTYRLGLQPSGLYRTDDGGAMWIETGQGVTGPQLDPNGVLYALGNGLHPFPIAVARSSDFGQTWTNIAIPGGFTPDSLAVTNSGVLLVLSASGGALIRSTDGGTTWTSAAGPWSTGATILAADAPGSTIYVSWPAPIQTQHAFAAKLDANGTILWATLLAGSQQEEGRAIAVDGGGNAYVAGTTSSIDFPLANAFQPAKAKAANGGINNNDAFLARISSDGSKLLYSTFLGGGGDDRANAIAVDAAGNMYLAGSTNGSGFPTANAIQSAPGSLYGSSFVAKFDSTGQNLLFSTYLSGTGGWPFNDTANAIAVDSSGVIWVGGQTGTVGFPLVNPIQPSIGPGSIGYIAKLRPAGTGYSLDFSSYLGSPNANIATLALSPAGAVWIAGTAAAGFLPNPPGAFLARLDLEPLPPPQPGIPLVLSVYNAASMSLASVISPGEIVTLIGAELAPAVASAQAFPLPTTLQDVTVEVNGVAVPLLYVSPTQINFQAPYDLPKDATTLVVRRGGQAGAPVPLGVMPATPGIFTMNEDYASPIVVHASDYRLVTAQNPTSRGEYLTIFCGGLGGTTPPARAGDAPSAAAPIQQTLNVVFDSALNTAPYAGISPGFAGLYQVNFQVPVNTAPGSNLIYLSIFGGPPSNQVQIYVQ